MYLEVHTRVYTQCPWEPNSLEDARNSSLGQVTGSLDLFP